MNAQYKQALQMALRYREAVSIQGRRYDPSAPSIFDSTTGMRRHSVDSNTANLEYIKALASAPDTEENREAAAKLIRDAYDECVVNPKRAWGDPAEATTSKMHALAAARIEFVNNFVWAKPNFMSWYFQDISLAPDEEPYVVNETMNESAVTFIGEDGTPDREHFVRPQSRTAIPLFFLNTKTARYKTLDLYRGNVAERTLVTLDLARDMAIKKDLTYFGLMNQPLANGGCYGAFSYEQGRSAPQSRIYVPHSGLQTSSLPQTNDWDMTQTSNTITNPLAAYTPPTGWSTLPGWPYALTGFGLPVLLAIKHYANLWGDLFDGGPLIPTGEVMVYPADIINIALQFLPVANANEQKVQEQITEQGYFGISYMGINWKFIPNMFIGPGTCYPRFSKLPGIAYSKPNLDREWVNVNVPENWEERSMRQVIGAALISQHRIRTMRIKYANISGSSSDYELLQQQADEFPTNAFPGANPANTFTESYPQLTPTS